MHRGSTTILKTAVLLMGLIVLALCLVGLPLAISSDMTGDYRLIFVGLYIPAIPFFIALFQALRLLGYIDRSKAFSDLSVAALRSIKYCALAISTLFIAGMPYIFHVADKDDAPGAILIGLVIISASFVIATFATLLQKLLQNAIDIQSENDLTV